MQEAPAQAKGLQLRREIDPALPETLSGDALRLRQVLLNYVGNAIKFSDRGAVTVRARAAETSEAAVLLRLEVQDEGIGLSAEQQARLFQSFSQADESTTRQFGGTGLGLAISKRIAELMGGEVGVVSSPGQGSTFWATMRLRRTGGRTASGVDHAGEGAARAIAEGFAGTTVLLAEDEPVSLEVARSLLENVGLVVEVARDGHEAVHRARRGGVALVLMDVQMPLMSGLEATRAIRRGPALQRLPIIALTAGAFDEDRQRCAEAGMNDHLAKPITSAALYSTLLRWLHQAVAEAPARWTSTT
jgi:CheY-like chemotaxis protein